MAEREQHEEKELRIMDSAIALISENGLAAMRLQDVAERAGVSVGAIQYYFRSRGDLIDQALLRHARESIEAIAVAPDPLDPWGVCERTLEAIAGRSELESRDRVWVMLNASALTSRDHLKLVQSIQNRWRGVLRDLVARGAAAGEFSLVGDAEEIVDQLLVMVDGYSMSNAVYGIDSAEMVEKMSNALKGLAIALLRPRTLVGGAPLSV